MIPHDILTLYDAKALEYAIALAFLVLFVPFWRFAIAERRALPAPARVAKRPMDWVEWFRIAGDVAYHPGHAWARVDGPALATVGADDFIQRLLGTAKKVELPPVGATLAQGEPGWRLFVDGKSVDMLAPVDGSVLAVNERVRKSPGLLATDPYGDGWLLKIETPRLAANQTSLLSGMLAHRWLETETQELRRIMSPELGLVMQDGGAPVDALALAIDAEHWDEVARRFLRS